MTDNFVLSLIVGIFWHLFLIACVLLRCTWTPMIPFYPLVLFGLGWLLNTLYPWAGTWAVAAVHLWLAAILIRNVLRRPSRNDGEPKSET